MGKEIVNQVEEAQRVPYMLNQGKHRKTYNQTNKD